MCPCQSILHKNKITFVSEVLFKRLIKMFQELFNSTRTYNSLSFHTQTHTIDSWSLVEYVRDAAWHIAINAHVHIYNIYIICMHTEKNTCVICVQVFECLSVCVLNCCKMAFIWANIGISISSCNKRLAPMNMFFWSQFGHILWWILVVCIVWLSFTSFDTLDHLQNQQKWKTKTNK